MKKSALVFLAVLFAFPMVASAQTIVYPKYNREPVENLYIYYPYTLKNLTGGPVVVYVYWSKEFKLKYELDAKEQTKEVFLPLLARVRVDAYIQKSTGKGTKLEKTVAIPYISHRPKFDRGWEIRYKR